MKHGHYFLSVNIVVTLFNVHRNKVEFGGAILLPLLDKLFVLFHDVVVAKNCKSKVVFVHFGL